MQNNQTQDSTGTPVRPASSSEGTQVITVRMPVSLHAALRREAYRRETSLNKLCIAALQRDLKESLEGSTNERKE